MANVRPDMCESIQNNRVNFRLLNLFARYCRSCISHICPRRANEHQNWENNHSIKRQLESAITTHHTSVLSSTKNIHNRNYRFWWSKKAEDTREADTNTTTRGQTLVPTQTLQARHYLHFAYSFTNYQVQGWLIKAIIKYYVESELPVDTYVVDEEGFQNFLRGLHFNSYGGFINTTIHRQEVRISHEGNWHFIIQNSSHAPTAIHYEVS